MLPAMWAIEFAIDAQMIEKPTILEATHPHFPSPLRASGPARIWALGNTAILREPLLGFLCSKKCPGDIILQTYDLARHLRDAGIAVIGGFHSPMERECLDLLLRGEQPVVVCPARGIEGMRLPPSWKTVVSERRLLILSLFEPKWRRVTRELAEQRNRFVADLAHSVLVPHAAPGGTLERLCLTLLATGQTVLTLDHRENDGILAAGAQPISNATVREFRTTLASGISFRLGAAER
jgi:predicted Rossmann fold nucleotide-binding protein DprA/Smf involved in DNA uptake